jgi:hypothetical protein
VVLDKLGLLGGELRGVAHQKLRGDVELAYVVQARRLPDGLGLLALQAKRDPHGKRQGGGSVGVLTRAREVLNKDMEQWLAALADHVSELRGCPTRVRGGLSLG